MEDLNGKWWLKKSYYRQALSMALNQRSRCKVDHRGSNVRIETGGDGSNKSVGSDWKVLGSRSGQVFSVAEGCDLLSHVLEKEVRWNAMQEGKLVLQRKLTVNLRSFLELPIVEKQPKVSISGNGRFGDAVADGMYTANEDEAPTDDGNRGIFRSAWWRTCNVG
ncbi:hypothetical protein NE237_029275 [Protea cynaroides]|uniref:Uncharacterized protein n=1 Tax=Protea cynaroides TaxID=273540 RepID=A0A9Q0JW39_9MAGN|nr:hypothetical protein NE237_029275 [Protea cynaroides]